MDIRTKRVYEKPSASDGFRILVDRIWPRGKTKREIQADQWFKEIGPSDSLRKWFGHDRGRWEQFKQRYFAELEKKTDIVEKIRSLTDQKTVTLLYSARDTENNQAVALKEYLDHKFIGHDERSGIK